MFFNFFSNSVYEEGYWIIVWEFDKAVQALLMEDGIELNNLSDKQLMSEIISLLKASLVNIKKQDLNWLSRYFEQEISFFRCFLNSETKLHSDDFKERIQCLKPNSNLEICIKKSSLFKDYIQKAVIRNEG